ncbi:hypothetical protein XaC1_236 [Xanthomonas phage XaC1]|nr:hypothetical protein XaC1_236 [Xanthomonas phage XaC1]
MKIKVYSKKSPNFTIHGIGENGESFYFNGTAWIKLHSELSTKEIDQMVFVDETIITQNNGDIYY